MERAGLGLAGADRVDTGAASVTVGVSSGGNGWPANGTCTVLGSATSKLAPSACAALDLQVVDARSLDGRTEVVVGRRHRVAADRLDAVTERGALLVVHLGAERGRAVLQQRPVGVVRQAHRQAHRAGHLHRLREALHDRVAAGRVAARRRRRACRGAVEPVPVELADACSGRRVDASSDWPHAARAPVASTVAMNPRRVNAGSCPGRWKRPPSIVSSPFIPSPTIRRRPDLPAAAGSNVGAMSKPLGPYTPVVRAGDFIVVSGQGGMADGAVVEGAWRRRRRRR